MTAGARTVRLCSVVVASAAIALLVATGCSSGNQPERSSSGAAPALAPAPAPEGPAQDTVADEPDIVTTGSMTMTVADPATAADTFTSATVDAGGRVESRTQQSGSSTPSVDLTLRIPSDKVDAVLAKVDELGVVESQSINYDDVTSQRVDLDARIKALQTSVSRLLDLMSKAANTEDLLAAESSLTERQADLDSLQAQRTALGDQIAYATITVALSSEPTVSRDGFVGAVQTGWRALVNAAWGVTQMIGFLLPWLPVLLVVGGGIFALARLAQRRGSPATTGPPGPSAPPASPPPADQVAPVESP